MSKYPFGTIEKKWQRFWEENKTFKVTEDPTIPKEKRVYLLDMFPYPSGAGLHVGHPEGYTATDIYGRFLCMNGYNVLHPMGFDSFGLPAENYAIQTGTHPKITTEENIKQFTRQIKSIGFAYDWDRMIQTHTPEYYRWTQWIFLQLYKEGLAYETEAPINWCPSCKTGLANEEVKDGRCDRCDSEVTRKNLRQWMLRITQYGDELLEGLDKIDWSTSIKTMQTNWIGRSEGANVQFAVDGLLGNESSTENITVYTTRPDTLFGATYMVLAPEHPLVDKITTPNQKAAVAEYRDQAAKKSDIERTELNKEKSGVPTGGYAINPVNGAKIPIWVADYVLISYGTGAIMAVPAHDERDWEFAKTYELPIIEVLQGGDVTQEAFTGDGPHVNSDFLNGMGKEEGIATMIAWLEKQGVGEKTVQYKLRDWLFCRQRYWGEPIPLVHCPACGIVPVPENQLPLTLPEVESYTPTGTGESPLAGIDDWVNTTCPTCGKPAKRETNTMPQWAGSCWYYLRYLDPHNTTEFAARDKIDYWMPVNLYVGGVEHAVLHLLYARFWHKVLYKLGLVPNNEPFSRLINQGLITSFAYQRKNKSLVPTDMVEETSAGVYVEKSTGEELTQIVTKMSKSLKNVVNPDEVIADYGADSLRLYEMFMGPLQVSKPWSTKGIQGVYRFLDRVWRASEFPVATEEAPKEVIQSLHKTIKKVTEDTANLEFNTAISQMMIHINTLFLEKKLYTKEWSEFVLLLAPYAPHLAEELWERLGNKESLAKHPWPKFDEKLTKDDVITVVFQVNGKVKSKAEVAADIAKEELEKLALADEKILSFTQGKTVRKVIVVPKKLVNVVV